MNQDPRLAYRESAVASASPVGLVIMLYDVLIEDLHRAIAALQSHNVETRTFELKHALGVIQQLQGSLQMEQGGDAARALDHFYSVMRAKLLEAQMKASAEILRQQIELFSQVREAWRSVDGRTTLFPEQQTQAPAAVLPGYAMAEPVAAHWSA